MKAPRRTLSIAVALVALLAAPASAQSPESNVYEPPLAPPPEVLGNPPETLGDPPEDPGSAERLPPTATAADLPPTVLPVADEVARADDARAGGASLPLTGLQIALIATGALGLVLLGVAIRRATGGTQRPT
jgi:hypothetical protein